jgi:hypothetical protein
MGVCEKIWGVHEKFDGCTSNLGGARVIWMDALSNLCMVHKDDLCIITDPVKM